VGKKFYGEYPCRGEGVGVCFQEIRNGERYAQEVKHPNGHLNEGKGSKWICAKGGGCKNVYLERLGGSISAYSWGTHGQWLSSEYNW